MRNTHTVKDPVCGMQLNEETAPYKTVISNRASHCGGYCGSMSCGKPTRGTAWFFYIGLLFLIVLLPLVIQ